MNRLLILPVLLLTLLLGTPAFSADFQKGVTAAQSGDYATALRELKPLAEQGDAESQFNLGVMYENGQGISKDYKTSVKFWHRLAVDEGNAIAQHNLGWLYQQGKGVPKNNKIAAKWWTLSANQGLANARFYNGLMYLLGPGAIQDYVFARLFNNWSLAERIGFNDNAAYWYTLAAKQGNASAQYNLGQMYRQGRGVPQDYKTAVKWFRLGAEQGVAPAQNNLGNAYGRGQGVIQDNVYAHMWFNIAASSGDKDAVKNRDMVAGRMTPAQLEKAQDLARECVRKKYKGC
jgi:TPR repeat protein